MIKATFTHSKELGSIAMSIKGHAGQAEKGKDIICSAASMLAYTIAHYLHYTYEQGGLKKKPRIVIKDGDAFILAKPTEEFEAEVLNAFFVAEVGYSLLAQNYPQYVELKPFGQA